MTDADPLDEFTMEALRRGYEPSREAIPDSMFHRTRFEKIIGDDDDPLFVVSLDLYQYNLNELPESIRVTARSVFRRSDHDRNATVTVSIPFTSFEDTETFFRSVFDRMEFDPEVPENTSREPETDFDPQ